jgi:hypothetical protein
LRTRATSASPAPSTPTRPPRSVPTRPPDPGEADRAVAQLDDGSDQGARGDDPQAGAHPARQEPRTPGLWQL